MRLEMGNICSSGQGSGSGSRPPRELSGLVREQVLSEQQEQKENRNQVSWYQEFIHFLQNRNQTELLNCLAFVLETERILVVGEEEDSSASSKRREEIRSTKVKMMREIGRKYFSTQSESCIPLSNQVLLEEAGSTLRGMEVDQLEDGVQLLLAASADHAVWRSGVDSAYRKFLATNPSSSLRAVLLSIL